MPAPSIRHSGFRSTSSRMQAVSGAPTPQRIGEILLSRGVVSSDDLVRALELQKERGEKIGRILVDAGFCAQRDVLHALSDQLNVRLIAIEGPPAVSPETEKLSPRFLRQFRCLPGAVPEATLTLAMADPLDFETLAAVHTFTGLQVDPVLASEQEIIDAVDRYYGETARANQEFDAGGQAAEDLEHLRDMASEAPVIRLVNAVIAQAVEKRASDIHIEPFEKEFRIRYRIDGVLYSQEQPPKELKAAIISRLKLM